MDPTDPAGVVDLVSTSPNSLIILAYMLSLAMLPFVAIMISSYVKIVVVIHLLRNALGIQQIPPNLAVNGLAIILSIYIMAPVFVPLFESIAGSGIDPVDPDVDAVFAAVGEAVQPVKDFLVKNSDKAQRDFFLRATMEMWPADFAVNVTDRNLLILVPAFMMSELRAAFEIGFLLYMPFIAIDLIVSNILLAMGMMMVSPMTISLPFKLLLFVIIDGWTKLIHGLVMSYA